MKPSCTFPCALLLAFAGCGSIRSALPPLDGGDDGEGEADAEADAGGEPSAEPPLDAHEGGFAEPTPEPPPDGGADGGCAGDAGSFCFISGTCYPSGQANPANACEECDPSSPNAWTNKAPGASCGDSADTECTHPDTCDGSGACLPNHEPPTTLCGNPGDGICDLQDKCDGLGACVDLVEPVTTECRSAMSDCDAPEFCDGLGSCPTDSPEPLGTPCGDPSSTECDAADTCDGGGTCLPNLAGLGAPCGDQSVPCHVDDSCDGFGGCADGGFASLGSPCGDQGVMCHLDDACDASGSCTDNGLVADTTPCGDPSATDCTEPDTCLAGSCVPNDMPDSTCCDDGNACTVGDTCVAGVCAQGPVCPADGCFASAGSCVAGACDYSPQPNCVSTVDASGDVGQDTSIAIGTCGRPIISYYDNGNQDLRVARCGDLGCSTPCGTSGTTCTTLDSLPDDVGHYTSIVIGDDGRPLVAYFRGAPSVDELDVAKCGDDGCTTACGVGGTICTPVIQGAGGKNTSIKIGLDGRPIISHFDDYSADDVMVTHCGTADCSGASTTTTLAGPGLVGYFTALAIGNDGLPIIAYGNDNTSHLNIAHCGDLTCSSPCGSGGTTCTDMGSRGLSNSIAIGCDGLPIVANANNIGPGDSLDIVHCGTVDCTEPCGTGGTTCTQLELNTNAQGDPSIGIGLDCMPVVSYRDNLNLDLKVAHCNDGACTSATFNTVDDGGGDSVGLYSSITIGADGLPIMSYYDETNGDLKVLKCASPSCSPWTGTPSTGAPEPRLLHASAWTGSEMIIWGGEFVHDGPVTNTGYRYDPVARTWAPMTTTGAPSPRAAAGPNGGLGVWVGSKFCVWGGASSDGGVWVTFGDGACYDPTTDAWTPITSNGAPSPRRSHAMVSTGTTMIVWGGLCSGAGCPSSGPFDDGAIYDPALDTWTPVSTAGGSPSPRHAHTAVWTGSEMIVWGGNDTVNYLDTGGRYDPVAQAWAALPVPTGLCARSAHVAVWTGTEMIVWGGYGNEADCGSGFPNSVDRYNASLDAWTSCCSADAPEGRQSPTGVWTGTEMIVWGGNRSPTELNSGGIFNPSADTWRPTPTSGSPAGRTYHTAAWTGAEMIVWGGTDSTVPVVFGDGASLQP
jgi:hypothetical protein